MPVYAKKALSNHPRFQDRETVVMVPMVGSSYPTEVTRIPIPNNVVLCNGCNQNISEMEKPEGYLVYLGKYQLAKDIPYDIYCSSCLRKYFPKATMVE